MDQFSIAMWAKISVELLQCVVVVVYLLEMEKYGRRRDCILDEQEARGRAMGRKLEESSRRLGQQQERTHE